MSSAIKSGPTRPSRFSELPEDVRAFVDSTMSLLALYMPGTCELEMMVGRNCKARLRIEGGPLSREVLDDTIAHLAFYKKYFPKNENDETRLTSPDKIVAALSGILDHHRAELSKNSETQG